MMTAYNGINGTPCNLNHEVNDIVKQEWGMDGFVVGDAGDVLGTVMDHHYVASYAEAVAGSVKAGIDSITDDQDIAFRALRDALEQGLLEEEHLTMPSAIPSASDSASGIRPGRAESIQPRTGVEALRAGACRIISSSRP